jgi:hypothetical protein
MHVPPAFIKGAQAMWLHLNQLHRDVEEISALMGAGPNKAAARMAYVERNCCRRKVGRAEVEDLNDPKGKVSIAFRMPKSLSGTTS